MSHLESFRVPLSIEEAKSTIRALAAEQSVLLAGPPGVGKSELVRQAAAEAGLELRVLMTPQLAPEDILGLPQLTSGGRTRFCPPESLVPESSDGRPVAIFLDELPSAASDTQRALHALLLDRTVGDHRLPRGSWVVAAGNRVEDGALARVLSTAVVNRLVVLDIEPSVDEWLVHARTVGVRHEILSYVRMFPEALRRDTSDAGRPMSTPRSWVALSRQLDAAERANLSAHVRRAIVAGNVSAEDAGVVEMLIGPEALEYIPRPSQLLADPSCLPYATSERWVALEALRSHVLRTGVAGEVAERLASIATLLYPEERAAFGAGLFDQLGALESAMLDTIAREAIG